MPLDWQVATNTAARLVRAGPDIPRAEADRVVRLLRNFSQTAEGYVSELTRMGGALPAQPADVVDRPGWIHSAAGGLAQLTEIALASDVNAQRELRLFEGVSARGAGVQAGVVLAYLGTKVLGQFDPFAREETPSERGDQGGCQGELLRASRDARGEVSPARACRGRLLLVAPNIVSAQRAIQVPAEDFAMWVCLHESTHRLQFDSVSWLRDYFVSTLADLLSAMDMTLTEVMQRLPGVARRMWSERGERAGHGSAVELTDPAGGQPRSPGMLGLVEQLQTPEGRAALDRVITLSTLLEGHADYVMDAVGPKVVPTVQVIRQRFTQRREGGGLVDRVLRSLLGVDAKIKQYEQGSAFTREVVDAVGIEGLNAVWHSPEQLPTRAEISNPHAWIRRVHG